MKTFKLISLDLLEDKNEEIIVSNIPLVDGLIIDREDEKNHWVIEALLNRNYAKYFNELNEKNEEFMLQAKITKPSNQPATFMCSILSINKMDEHINVLFLGSLIDRKKGQIERTLRLLIDEGYQGEELLDEFKDRV
ncbi:YwpF-like family protein [Aquibacillus salsiterrae]|uniref:YwpF-like family protein n=1 Tax=Aquibacillus salsiterrae TaxID=2950439 RepID=A0A9X4AE93_9BACI|nr:YwpF-like family protein [Aquibacillus salsiterrae]MDC3416557.1 YwpF-like family protein [Aquibacillus salsiterrae]